MRHRSNEKKEEESYYCRMCGAKNSGRYRIIERSVAVASITLKDGEYEEGDDYETTDYIDSDRDGVECKKCNSTADDETELFTTHPETVRKACGRQVALRMMPTWEDKAKLMARWKFLPDPKEVKDNAKKDN